MRELIEEFRRSGAFNAGRLADACQLYRKMLAEQATVALTVSGAMSPTGLGGPIIEMMRRGLIDSLVSTGANVYHDLHFALDLPVHQGDSRVDDTELLRHGIVRIYDVFITEDLLLQTDRFVREAVADARLKEPVSTAELHHLLGQAVLKKAPYPERSLVAQAATLGVPIYTPSPGDSSIGMNLAGMALLNGRSATVDPNLDVIESTALVYRSAKNGVVIVGGGAPKNFYLQTQPQLSQILGIQKGGHDYVIQITVDAPHYGGLSGATPSEAVSWGKVNPREVANHVIVYSDATIALPLLLAYVLTTEAPRPLKRLYDHRKESVQQLRAAVQAHRSSLPRLSG